MKHVSPTASGVVQAPPSPCGDDHVLRVVDHVDAGVVYPPAGSSCSHRMAPDRLSNARIFSSGVAAMNTTPPTVRTTLRDKVLVFGMTSNERRDNWAQRMDRESLRSGIVQREPN